MTGRPRETDPAQGSLFAPAELGIVSRLKTAPGDDKGAKRKAPRKKSAAELVGKVTWKPYSAKTRVQCSDCVAEAKASWDAGKPLERPIGAARWIRTEYVRTEQLRSVIDAKTTNVYAEQNAYLCGHHASERGHTNAAKGRKRS
jgi:hypothetical protein